MSSYDSSLNMVSWLISRSKLNGWTVDSAVVYLKSKGIEVKNPNAPRVKLTIPEFVGLFKGVDAAAFHLAKPVAEVKSDQPVSQVVVESTAPVVKGKTKYVNVALYARIEDTYRKVDFEVLEKAGVDSNYWFTGNNTCHDHLRMNLNDGPENELFKEDYFWVHEIGVLRLVWRMLPQVLNKETHKVAIDFMLSCAYNKDISIGTSKKITKQEYMLSNPGNNLVFSVKPGMSVDVPVTKFDPMKFVRATSSNTPQSPKGLPGKSNFSFTTASPITSFGQVSLDPLPTFKAMASDPKLLTFEKTFLKQERIPELESKKSPVEVMEILVNEESNSATTVASVDAIDIDRLGAAMGRLTTTPVPTVAELEQEFGRLDPRRQQKAPPMQREIRLSFIPTSGQAKEIERYASVGYAIQPSNIARYSSKFNGHGALKIDALVAEEFIMSLIDTNNFVGKEKLFGDVGACVSRSNKRHMWAIVPPYNPSAAVQVPMWQGCNCAAQSCTHLTRLHGLVMFHSVYYFTPSQLFDIISKTKDKVAHISCHRFDEWFGEFHNGEGVYMCDLNGDVQMTVRENSTPFRHSACHWMLRGEALDFGNNGESLTCVFKAQFGAVAVYQLSVVKGVFRKRVDDSNAAGLDWVNEKSEIQRVDALRVGGFYRLTATGGETIMVNSELMSRVEAFLMNKSLNSSHIVASACSFLRDEINKEDISGLKNDKLRAIVLQSVPDMIQVAILKVAKKMSSVKGALSQHANMLATADARPMDMIEATWSNVLGKCVAAVTDVAAGLKIIPQAVAQKLSAAVDSVVSVSSQVKCKGRDNGDLDEPIDDYGTRNVLCQTTADTSVWWHFALMVTTAADANSIFPVRPMQEMPTVETNSLIVLQPAETSRKICPLRDGAVLTCADRDVKPPTVDYQLTGFSFSLAPVAYSRSVNNTKVTVAARVATDEVDPEDASLWAAIETIFSQREIINKFYNVNDPRIEPDFNHWVNKYTADKKRLYLEAKEEMLSGEVNSSRKDRISNSFLKCELTVGDTVKSLINGNTEPDGRSRVIFARSAKIGVILGPQMEACVRNSVVWWNVDFPITTAVGRTSLEIGLWVTKIENNAMHVWHADMAMFDATQRVCCNSTMATILYGLTESQDVYDILMRAIDKDAQFVNGVRLQIEGGLPTGIDSTTFSNGSLVALGLVISLAVFKYGELTRESVCAVLSDGMEGKWALLCNGDDTLTAVTLDYIGKPKALMEHVTTTFQSMGQKYKPFYCADSYHLLDFCSGRFKRVSVKGKDVWALVPKPFRLMYKFGWISARLNGIKTLKEKLNSLWNVMGGDPFLRVFRGVLAAKLNAVNAVSGCDTSSIKFRDIDDYRILSDVELELTDPQVDSDLQIYNLDRQFLYRLEDSLKQTKLGQAVQGVNEFDACLIVDAKDDLYNG